MEPIEARSTLWAEAQERLCRMFGDELFDRWLSGLSFLGVEAGRVRLGAPTRFVQEWVQDRFAGGLRQVFRECLGADLAVELSLDPAPARTSAAPAAAEPAGAGAPAEPAGGADLRPSLETFVVDSSNELAFNAVLEVLRNPGNGYNPLFVHGGPGVGKTHLLKAVAGAFRTARGRQVTTRLNQRLWSRRAPGLVAAASPFRAERQLQARYTTAERFFHEFVSSLQAETVRQFRERYRTLDVLIVDDIQWLDTKKKTQIEFLHTFNCLVETGRQLVIGANAPPKRLAGLLPPLAGRFLSGLVTRIGKPSHAMRLEVARRQAERLGCRVGGPVLELLAREVPGSCRELMGALMQLDVHARVRGQPLDVEAAREVLAEFLRGRPGRLDCARISAEVARYYGIAPQELAGNCRDRSLTYARQVAMYLCRSHTSSSLSEIGKFFGNRSHTTVRWAAAKVDRLVRSRTPAIIRDLEVLREVLEE